MTDGDQLLAAIIAHPDEDTPRLAYADWLDEQGGKVNVARAEFIRTQIGLRTMHPDNAQRAAARCRTLLIEFRDDWLADVPQRLRSEVEFARGFVEVLRVTTKKCRPAERPSFDRHPLRSVSLSGGGQPLAKLVEAGWLFAVPEVRIEAEATSADDLAAVVARCAAPCVRRLTFNADWLSDAGAASLTNSEAFKNLEELDLTGSLSPSGWENVVDSPTTAAVSRLRMCQRLWSGSAQLWIQAVPGASLGRILTSPRLSGLRTLAVEGWQLDDGVWELIAGTTLPSLQSLAVVRSGLRPESVTAFTTSDLARRLTYLDLSGNRTLSAVAGALAAGGPFDRLAALNLNGTNTDDEAALALARSDAFPALTELSLLGCRLTDIGASRLLSANFADRLRRLSLGSNRITEWMQGHLRKRFGAALEL